MVSLEQKIQNELIFAMKSKNQLRLQTMRSIKAAIQSAKTAKGSTGEVTDADVLKLIQKLIKQREESSNLYKEAGRNELAEIEIKEASIMAEFIPKQMTEEEVEAEVNKVISETGASSMRDMGNVMKILSTKLAGKADGKAISTIVKSKLS